MPTSFATGGALFSRCAAKNAKNVAPTRSTKTARAKKVTRAGYDSLIGAGEHDNIGIRRHCTRFLVKCRNVADAEPLGDAASLGAIPVPVVDGGPLSV